MESLEFQLVQLHHDYEEVSVAGLRRAPAEAEMAAAVQRLEAVNLLTLDSGYLTLQRPEYSDVPFPAETLTLLTGHYEYWLHAEHVSSGEQLLYGQAGFWQHWLNLLHETSENQLRMDLVVADTPEVAEHDWMSQLRLDLFEEVVQRKSMTLRLLLPPSEPESQLGQLAALLSQVGFEVRMRSSPFLFAVYDGRAAVIADDTDGEEGYFLTKRQPIVEPLQRMFDEKWASAIPWESFTHGTAEVLELMSLGWTDSRIAESLGLSMRTVTRRVADAMSAAGVASRFELGIRYAHTKALRYGLERKKKAAAAA